MVTVKVVGSAAWAATASVNAAPASSRLLRDRAGIMMSSRASYVGAPDADRRASPRYQPGPLGSRSEMPREHHIDDRRSSPALGVAKCPGRADRASAASRGAWSIGRKIVRRLLLGCPPSFTRSFLAGRPVGANRPSALEGRREWVPWC